MVDENKSEGLEIFLTKINREYINGIGFRDEINLKNFQKECDRAKKIYKKDYENVVFFLDERFEEDKGEYIFIYSDFSEKSINVINGDKEFENKKTIFVNTETSNYNLEPFIKAKKISLKDLKSDNNYNLKIMFLNHLENGYITKEIIEIWEKDEEYYYVSLKLKNKWVFAKGLGHRDLNILEADNSTIGEIFAYDRFKKYVESLNKSAIKRDYIYIIFEEPYYPHPNDLLNTTITFKSLSDNERTIERKIDLSNYKPVDYYITPYLVKKGTNEEYDLGDVDLETFLTKNKESVLLKGNQDLFPKGFSGESSLSVGDNQVFGYKFNLKDFNGTKTTKFKEQKIDAGNTICIGYKDLYSFEGIPSESSNEVGEIQIKKSKSLISTIEERLKTTKLSASDNLYFLEENTKVAENGIVYSVDSFVCYGFNETNTSVLLDKKKENTDSYYSLFNYFSEVFEKERYENLNGTKECYWRIVPGNKICVDTKFIKEHGDEIKKIKTKEKQNINYKKLAIDFCYKLDEILNTKSRSSNQKILQESFIQNTKFENINPYYVAEMAAKYYEKEKTDDREKYIVYIKQIKDRVSEENLKELEVNYLTSEKIYNGEEETVKVKEIKNNYWLFLKATALKDLYLDGEISFDIDGIVNYFPVNKTEITSEIKEEDNFISVEKFIKSWSISQEKKEDDKTPQKIIPVNNYYDMLSGMTPYIEVGFRKALIKKDEKDGASIFIDGTGKKILKKTVVNEKIEYTNPSTGEHIDEKKALDILSKSYFKLNSIAYPFFKSLNIKDKGFKTFTLTLFDKDFGSFNRQMVNDNGEMLFNKEGNISGEYFSLDELIRSALVSPTASAKEKLDVTNNRQKAYTEDGGEIGNDYLTFNEDIPSNPANIKLRWGYCDCNEKMSLKNETNNLKNNFYDPYNSKSRDGRWWEAKEIGKKTNAKNMILSKYVKNNDSNIYHNVKIENNDNKNPENSIKTNISFENNINSSVQTAVMSREYEFIITGFKTKLKPNGIEYIISGIEAKDGNLLMTRFMQKYAEITSYPEEVLYLLEHIFNENNKGENITSSKIKIVLQEDTQDPAYSKNKDVALMLNQEYDYNALTEKQRGLLDGKTTYQNYVNGGAGALTLTKALKNITISLGGDEAIRNYGDDKVIPLYKSVSSLMDEFCASCPPKEIFSFVKSKEKETYGNMGEKVVENKEPGLSRPLKWYTIKEDNSDITYIVLYYRSPNYQSVIRKYTWGPHNPNLSCVKDLSIENKNEFAVLSGVSSFPSDGGNNTVISRKNLGLEPNERATQAKYAKNDEDYTIYNIAGDNAKLYERAFSQSMYTGTLSIPGDPFYAFDASMQPYTYAISLDVLLPTNTTTAKRNIPAILESYGSRDFNGNGEGNQMLHESSGYYVISEITHDITPNGYNTTLGITSYPNIQKDVIKKDIEGNPDANMLINSTTKVLE